MVEWLGSHPRSEPGLLGTGTVALVSGCVLPTSWNWTDSFGLLEFVKTWISSPTVPILVVVSS
jgi:hypothetical protein